METTTKALKFLYYRHHGPLSRMFLSVSRPQHVRCCLQRPATTLPADADCQRHRTVPPRYFITTPIFYVNAAPHIGHLYSGVLADAISRWYRVLGVPVTFSTGTDEHGLKIQQAAAKAGKDPQAFCDGVSPQFKNLFDLADVQYTDFVRTTEQRHIRTAQKLWTTLEDRGYIYKGAYEGWYSVSDEVFLSEAETMQGTDKDGKTCKVSADSGQPVEWHKEENYMFRLSEFAPQLTEWLNKSECHLGLATGARNVITPAKFETVVRRRIEDGLPDLSISRQRERLHWGIPVPGDGTQIMYVWLDALTNYLTVSDSESLWPADCHVIGQDILSFHAVYWPAFLMAAGLEPPRQILCHSHWTIAGLKMSKSRGNVIDPFDRIEKYSSDAVRYFLLREGVPHSNGNYSDEQLVKCVNSELANTLGNLLSRCSACSLNRDQAFPVWLPAVFDDRCDEEDRKMWADLASLPVIADGHYRDFNVYKALDAIMGQLRHTNVFVQKHEPWLLKDNPAEQHWLDTILHVAMETVRVSAILLQPVVPKMAAGILDRLNVPGGERYWKDLPHRTERAQLGKDIGASFSRIKLKV